MRHDGVIADNCETWKDETPAMTLARGSAPKTKKKEKCIITSEYNN